MTPDEDRPASSSPRISDSASANDDVFAALERIRAAIRRNHERLERASAAARRLRELTK